MKLARSGVWACSRCLRQSLRQTSSPSQRRWRSGAPAAVKPDFSALPPTHAPPGARHDDSLLRQIFDSPKPVSDRLAHHPLSMYVRGQSAGLFRNKYLTSPDGFLRYADVTLKRAQKLVQKALRASTLEDYKAIVRDMDRLSDLLCRVLDVSEFVRVTHPDPSIQAAASQAWAMTFQYMNELNTTTGLSAQLGKALDTPEVMASWSEEEQTVARLLQEDFTKSAIHHPKESRDEFVQLSQTISELGSYFVEQAAPEQEFIALPSSCFNGLDPQVAVKFTRRGQLRLPTMSPAATAALRSVHGEDTRKVIYYATRTASRQSIAVLERMLEMRSHLAGLSGFENYGQMALRDRMMAKSPESVYQFLLSLAKHNAPLVEKEAREILREKQRRFPSSTGVALHPWDVDYYNMGIIRRRMWSERRYNDSESAYLSLGTVMQGLSRLFTRLYGIRFMPRDALPGETWHPDVRRLDVVSDSGGLVAVLYCDLFYREGKSPNPAHFTVRCSREISEEEIREAAQEQDSGELGDLPRFDSATEAANDGMHYSSGSFWPVKQLPTIALVCDFRHDERARRKPAYLDYGQMETVFHEMGHAIHSILARTSLQNVSGTRCATDLAELPSTLMEHFCADPSVLALFARHHETDEPLPYEMVAERLRVLKRGQAVDRENQIILAMLDQEYHSRRPSDKDFDSTKIFHDLQRKHKKMPPDAPGTSWQGFFSHLFGYGSTYYCYLFDQILSERIWRVVFQAGQDGKALDRARGEALKENLLKWGGGRDPWKCLADTLGDERLRDGGGEAMSLVGSWGSRADNAHD